MKNPIWKIFTTYLFVLLLLLVYGNAFSQIEIKQFNAGWNSANDVPWVMDLADCKTISYTDVAKDAESQKKYKIAVVPTIIVFKDGEEVKRFQADISFAIKATIEEVQEVVDDSNMDSW